MNILIISEYIAPKQTIGSVRWTKVAKYLKRHHDVNIDVLTTENLEWPVDNLLKQDLSVFTQYIEFRKDLVSRLLARYMNYRRDIDIPKQHDLNRASSTHVFEKSTIRHKIRVILQELGMQLTARKAYRAYSKTHQGHYDILVSSYGPIWCHMAASMIKADYSAAFWLADFRDIYAGNAYESESDYYRHKQFVQRKLSTANIITKVTDELKIYEGDDQTVVVLPNGFDPEETPAGLPPKLFSIVYTGTLYEGESDLTPIFLAITKLIGEGKIDYQDVAIEYAGVSSELFNQQVNSLNMNIKAVDHGLLAREDAIQLQRQSAILLQATSYNECFQPLWTGKMFEYMMMEKPIIYLLKTSLHTRVSDEINRIGGIVYEECFPESFNLMCEYIYEKYCEWKGTGNIVLQQDTDYILDYSYESIAEKFWKIIHED